jgi:hypothetical protein
MVIDSGFAAIGVTRQRQILGEWVGSPVGVPGEQAIGSLLPDGLLDGESLGLIIASLLSECVTRRRCNAETSHRSTANGWARRW